MKDFSFFFFIFAKGKASFFLLLPAILFCLATISTYDTFSSSSIFYFDCVRVIAADSFGSVMVYIHVQPARICFMNDKSIQ